MKRKVSLIVLALGLLLTVATIGVAQRGYGGRRGRFGGALGPVGFDSALLDRGDVPDWENDPEFKRDVFTFVRVKYSSRRDWREWGRWAIDYPDSDLNFSFRLHELTALDVAPRPEIIELTDERLFDYPFIYLLEPGDMDLQEAEVLGLRRYLENGGFLMVDDFWGEWEWNNFHQQIKRVFPNREPVELPLEHEIFHCVYDLKQKPQVPSIGHWYHGQTTERPDAREAHYRALFDDDDRMMAIICHNTDLGDGWEQEGANADYFREMSERWAYPLGINIVTYAMTH